jgi:predicted alpha/beta-hydrolase family hydrolase
VTGTPPHLLVRPEDARWLLVLAHGAGAGMRSAAMESIVRHLAAVGVATFRYEFPYMQKKKRAPDPAPVLMATVRAALAAAVEQSDGLPLLAGGKSMGGRMTSMAAAETPLAGVRGLVFFGFPLHPAGKPGIARAQHLDPVTVPMLFLQGTRDALADPALLRQVGEPLGARATMHFFENADHSFHVPKGSGRTDEQVLAELAEKVAVWAGVLG